MKNPNSQCTTIILLLILIVLTIGVGFFISITIVAALKLPELISVIENTLNNATTRIDTANYNVVRLIELLNKIKV